MSDSSLKPSKTTGTAPENETMKKRILIQEGYRRKWCLFPRRQNLSENMEDAVDTIHRVGRKTEKTLANAR